MPQITAVTVEDVRFPTSLTADGSDAMNTDGHSSAAYVVLHTDYRNHAQSSKDPSSEVMLRLGYTEDAINVNADQQGLGALIQNASSFFQLDIIYVGIICIGLIALAMDLALRAAAVESPASPREWRLRRRAFGGRAAARW